MAQYKVEIGIFKSTGKIIPSTNKKIREFIPLFTEVIPDIETLAEKVNVFLDAAWTGYREKEILAKGLISTPEKPITALLGEEHGFRVTEIKN